MKDDLTIPAESLPIKFFARHANDVAQDLLGRILVIERKDDCTLYAKLQEVAAYEGKAPTASKGTLYAPGIMAISTKHGKKIIDIATLVQGKSSCVTLIAATVYDQSGVRTFAQGPGNLSQALEITSDYDAIPIGMLNVWIGGNAIEPSQVRQRNLSRAPENCKGIFYFR